MIVRHICHVTTVHPWFDIRIFHHMCRGLVDRGYTVTLVAPVAAPRIEQGVSLVPTGLTGRVARVVNSGRIGRLLRTIPADVFHFHDPELLPCMTWFHRATGRRTVYDVHEYYPESVVDSNYFGFRPFSALAGLIFSGLEPALARRLSGVVGVTEPIAHRFRGGKARVAVVRNFISLSALVEQPRPGDLPSARTLVLAGTLDDNRLMPQLIDALSIISRGWPDVTLLCIGEIADQPYGSSLRRRAERRGVADRLVYHPRLPWDRVQEYISASVAGLVLYADRRNNRWGLPNRLFEFMAHGIPIVATDFPLLREIVEGSGCGVVIESGTPEAIAEALERVFRDPNAARRMGEAGREAVRKEYNWEQELNRLIELYDLLD
jgi:glycosyltransferase involved in cell wall biosynthesis